MTHDFTLLTHDEVGNQQIHQPFSVMTGITNDKTKKVFGMSKSGGLAVSAPSMASLLSYMRVAHPTPKKTGDSSKSRDGDDSFYTFDSYEDAIDTFQHKPHELAIYKMAEAAIVIPDAPGIQVDYDVIGDDLDMGRYLEGDPLCYSYMTMGNTRNIVANISISASAPWYIEHQAFSQKVARVCRLCDWLEANRVRTRIVAVSSSECGHFEVVIKEYGDPMYLPNVASVTHGDFLRRIIFRMKEYSATHNSYYGTAMNITQKDHAQIKPEYGAITILIDQSKTPDLVNEKFDAIEKEIAELIPSIAAGEYNAAEDWPVLKIKGYNND